MSRSKALTIALVTFAIAGLACTPTTVTLTAAPTPTTPPTKATATSVSISSPIPKPSATDTRAPTARSTTASLPSGVLFRDDFSSQEASEDKGWVIEPGDSVDWLWSPKKLTAFIKEKQLIGWNAPGGSYDNMGAEVEAQAVTSDYAEYGIIFRVSGTKDARSYYIFGVTTDGEYYLEKKLDGKWADKNPVPFTASAYIKPKDKNTLGVLAQSNKISLYINTFPIKTVTDDSLASGAAGVFASTGDDNDSAQVAFSRFTVLTPEKAKAEFGATPAADSPVQPAATATKAGAGSGYGTIIVRNTFPGACQANLFGRQEAVVRAEGHSSASKALPPGKYGVHLAVDIGEVDMDQFTLPAGGTCILTCDAATRSVYNSCR